MNFNESSPIYLQIAEKLCDGVLSGLYGAGQRIPSVREMAVAIEVNPNTVQRTYTTLQEWGIVEMRRGQGVAPDALSKTRARRRRTLEQEEIPRIIAHLNALSMSIDEFSALCRQIQERQQTESEEKHNERIHPVPFAVKPHTGIVERPARPSPTTDGHQHARGVVCAGGVLAPALLRSNRRHRGRDKFVLISPHRRGREKARNNRRH